MRPPNHMPCSPDEATVAVLGDVAFERKKKAISPWLDPTMDEWFTTDQLIRYGATFYKPVPNPPENTRELTEEDYGDDLKNRRGWYLDRSGNWQVVGGFTPNPLEPWRCRVPIEKVVAWRDEDFNGEPTWCAWFANQEDRDRAVKEANGRES